METLINESNYKDEKIIYPPKSYTCTISATPQYDEYFNCQINDNINQTTSRVIMIDSNNFKINVDPCYKCINIYFFIVSIISFSIIILLLCFGVDLILVLIPTIFFIILFPTAMIWGFKSYYIKYVTIEDNSIILTKKSLLKSKVIIFSSGQLERAEILYKYDFILQNFPYNFIFYLVPTTGNKIELFQVYSRRMDVDLKGIKYFADLINYHIKNNM